MQEEQIQSGAAPRKSAPPPPRPITDEDENIDAKPTQRPNLPPSELEQYAGSGDENEGPQKPAQRVENEPVGEQAQMFEASGRTQSTKKRSTKPKKPTTVLLQAAERALGDLGLMVNRRDMLPALQEALDLGVTETELPDLLAWATQGYRSQYYSISRLPNDARAYRVYQTQEQRQRPPMTTDPELSAYLDSLAQTPEEREEQQAHIREYFRQREEAKKPENWWASPEEVARIQRQRDEEVRREEERRLKQRKRMALEKEKDIRKLPFELMPRQAQEIIASRPDMWERYGVTEERIAQCFG
jgi:hypothetical protein